MKVKIRRQTETRLPSWLIKDTLIENYYPDFYLAILVYQTIQLLTIVITYYQHLS
ncbi:MAG: hypothetical protein RG740_04735 [Acholeplasmataceae bacterium]|nr:hypothetical protein [Acholeplasmataceae bacterium]